MTSRSSSSTATASSTIRSSSVSSSCPCNNSSSSSTASGSSTASQQQHSRPGGGSSARRRRRRLLARRVAAAVTAILYMASRVPMCAAEKMYIPPMQPEDLSGMTLDDMLVGCPGECEREYVRRLYTDATPAMARSAQRAVCVPPPPPEDVSSKPLVIGAGPGTTATRSVSKAVNMLGLRVVHFGAGFEKDGQPYPATGVKSACGNWDRNLATYGVNDMYDMLLLNATTVAACHDALDAYNLRLYDDLDAVFDSPVHHVTYRLLHLYPNAKFIFTHRDPAEWVVKRVAHQMAMPAVQMPCGTILEHLTDEQNIAAYMANLELLRCLIPPDRLLMVNVWEEEGREIFESLADFLGRPVPPQGCAFPGKVDHCLYRPGEVARWRNKAPDACMKFQRSAATAPYVDW